MTIIHLDSREAQLKRKVRTHLKEIGFTKAPDGTLLPPNSNKETYRGIHSHQRLNKLAEHQDWILNKAPKLIQYFASGSEVDVHKIQPRLELIRNGKSWQSDLFRFATLYWRIPVSSGFGRRLRFLVWDDSNKKLIGLIALGDAVFNLSVRDKLIGWDHKRRADGLVNLMDAYVLGAVPPYNMLLGGKLVASLTRTQEIVKAFEARYMNSIGLISNKSKNACLAAVTTSSALGRSSVYNRLKLNGEFIFKSIGYTSGYGHFHISEDLFKELRDYLVSIEDSYANSFEFGQGPNWKIRVIRKALGSLGMNPNIVRHGLAREVFFCPIANNAIEFLRGEHKIIEYDNLLTVEAISRMALARWIIPRAERMPEYITWQAEQILESLSATTSQLTFQPQGRIWTGLGIG